MLSLWCPQLWLSMCRMTGFATRALRLVVLRICHGVRWKQSARLRDSRSTKRACAKLRSSRLARRAGTRTTASRSSSPSAPSCARCCNEMSQTPPKPSSASESEPASTYVGRPMDRIDGRLKVTGAARYAAEFEVPGITHAVLIQSTVARGRVIALDASAAENAPGVLTVMTFKNSPAMPLPSVPPAGTSVPLLSGEILHSGQNIAVVVAETLEQAQDAAALIDIEYS